MNDTGFIKISRKFFEHRYWNEPREYSRAEAWIDLIQSARFDGSIVLLNGRDVEVRRGELIASRRFLEKRWKWSNTKVDNFLSDLEKSHMITKRSAIGNTILTLCNYDTYNSADATKNAKETPPKRQADASRTPKYKKEKEREEGKEIIPPIIPPGGNEATKQGEDLSFVENKEFIPAVSEWLEYKKQKGQTYKGEKSLKTMYNKLVALSRGDPNTALLIVFQSMAANWSGFFELKSANENATNTRTTKHTANQFGTDPNGDYSL